MSPLVINLLRHQLLFREEKNKLPNLSENYIMWHPNSWQGFGMERVNAILFVFKYQGLKKVTNDMKTHKNPELRKQVKPVSSSPKPYKAPAAAKPVAAAKPAQVKKPASTQLNMKRWDVVSDQTGVMLCRKNFCDIYKLAGV